MRPDTLHCHRLVAAVSFNINTYRYYFERMPFCGTLMLYRKTHYFVSEKQKMCCASVRVVGFFLYIHNTTFKGCCCEKSHISYNTIRTIFQQHLIRFCYPATAASYATCKSLWWVFPALFRGGFIGTILAFGSLKIGRVFWKANGLKKAKENK